MTLPEKFRKNVMVTKCIIRISSPVLLTIVSNNRKGTAEKAQVRSTVFG